MTLNHSNDSAGDSAAGTLRFVLDGKLIEVPHADPTRTVLQFLREDLGRIGSKEGCAEGDCGACTVALAEIAPDGEHLQVRAVNACIQFLPTLDGKELITVESLRGRDGRLHPVQQAMVDCHGSQCGFCTPGFVMSMFALYKNHASPGRREIDDALAGNLCRCTGYRPIVKAAREMYRLAEAREQADDWLLTPNGAEHGADETVRVAVLRSIERKDSFHFEGFGKQFYAPGTLVDLARLIEAEPEATLLAGGTDVGLWVTKQLRELHTVIYTGQVRELRQLTVTDTHIDIGAAVSLTDAMPAIVAHYPELLELLLRFASPPIRNAGTLGGNICNGSPIGDSMPALLVLDAVLTLRKGSDTRQLPLREFYIGYQETALARGELLARVSIPLPEQNAHIRSYKVSKRFDQDISAVCAAYWLKLDGTRIAGVRIAYGGLAAVPKRATRCEQALAGKEWTEENVRAAMTALASDFQPIADMRSSADYRRRLCRNLLYRFYLETSGVAVDSVYDYGRQQLA